MSTTIKKREVVITGDDSRRRFSSIRITNRFRHSDVRPRLFLCPRQHLHNIKGPRGPVSPKRLKPHESEEIGPANIFIIIGPFFSFCGSTCSICLLFWGVASLAEASTDFFFLKERVSRHGLCTGLVERPYYRAIQLKAPVHVGTAKCRFCNSFWTFFFGRPHRAHPCNSHAGLFCAPRGIRHQNGAPILKDGFSVQPKFFF